MVFFVFMLFSLLFARYAATVRLLRLLEAQPPIVWRLREIDAVYPLQHVIHVEHYVSWQEKHRYFDYVHVVHKQQKAIQVKRNKQWRHRDVSK